jgi:hypothetical protein
MGPSKFAEAIVSFFLPPARRDEVLGDLHERYRSPLQYAWEAALVVVCVMFSEFSKGGDKTMNVKTVAAIVLAFICGLTIGSVTQLSHGTAASLLVQGLPFVLLAFVWSSPFLALLALWAVLLKMNRRRPKPKC